MHEGRYMADGSFSKMSAMPSGGGPPWSNQKCGSWSFWILSMEVLGLMGMSGVPCGPKPFMLGMPGMGCMLGPGAPA